MSPERAKGKEWISAPISMKVNDTWTFVQLLRLRAHSMLLEIGDEYAEP
jgi:hypothetical protein